MVNSFIGGSLICYKLATKCLCSEVECHKVRQKYCIVLKNLPYCVPEHCVIFPISVLHPKVFRIFACIHQQLNLHYVAIPFLADGIPLYPPFGPCQSLLPRLLAYCVVLGPHLLSHVASAMVEVQEYGQVASPAAV